jgi:peptide/nickel transport system ATP-binding protein
VTSQALLTVTGLGHRYDQRRHLFSLERSVAPALDNISFDVKRAESFGIVGESGSGKSTLGRILSGLLRPTAGSVLYDGRPVNGPSTQSPAWLHSQVQIVLQDPYSSLNPRSRIGSILARPLIVQGKDRRTRDERVKDLLEMVDLPGTLRRFPGELSGGQRQRVAIARALAVDPRILVLDEPTSSLDAWTQAQIINLLSDLRTRLELTCIFISHNLALVAYFCDRTLVLHRGRAVETGDSADLYFRPRHHYTQELMAAVLEPYPRQTAGEKGEG